MVCNNSNEWLRLLADMSQEEAIPAGREVTQNIAIDPGVASEIGLSGIYKMDPEQVAAELATFEVRAA